MKIRIYNFLFILLFTILFAGCNERKQTNTKAKENQPQSDLKTDKQASANNDIDLQAPDFADPELKRYYSVYTAYLKKVVTAIRDKDETGTMKIFREEGKQFDNRNEMDQKAKPEEEQKFTSWLLQSMPLQTEII
jgi:PBP1b-binding outer membrane lipoprotein LpoB